MFDNLTEDNILLYATKAYDKPNCVMSEFLEDMKRFNYLNKLFMRYRKYDELRERLILNHLMILYNVFGPEVVSRLLFYKVEKEDYSSLKTFLLFLNIMPDKIKGINGADIISSYIPVDMKIANKLRAE